MSQNSRIKTCLYCGSENDAYEMRCGICGKSLATARSKSKPLSSQPSTPIPTMTPVHLGKRPLFRMIIGIILVIFISLVVIFSHVIGGNGQSTTLTPGPSPTQGAGLPSLPNGLGEITLIDDKIRQNIGVNDGSFAPFDIGRAAQEEAFKQQAATALKQGNAQAAIALWSQALGIESNDAEACIYIEDQRVLASKRAYVTLIAGTSFTPPFPDAQYEGELQGIYVAQHEFNQEHSNLQVRVLIANLGDSVDASNTPPVIQQITQVATKDTTVVGIIGWLNSSSTLNALIAMGKFKNINIPIISPQASSDGLSGISSYFFRVIGPNKGQAQAAAQFMKNFLHVKNPVVFVDPNDAYSQNLAQDFEEQFAPGRKLPEVNFKTDSGSDFATLITQAEQQHPDAFYFTSPSYVDAGRFQDALPVTGLYGKTPVVAGDGGYAIHPHSYGRWYFTEYAYHSEKSVPIAQRFAQDFTTDFDPYHQKPDGTYSYSLADDHAILGYDATSVVFAALDDMTNGNVTLTSDMLAKTLPSITGANAFQGVSGQIAFDRHNDPINKAIVILYASKDGHTTLYTVEGCFVKGCL